MSLLPTIWLGIIAFCILMYVILDGFTLGAGLLLPFIKKPQDRNIIFSTLLPTWDGNQTWLVLGAASLYGAFPRAFSILLPNLYFPLLMMVLALLFRGVCFEFRLKASTSAIPRWDRLFFSGSLIATLMQGLVLGTFIHGFGKNISVIKPEIYLWVNPFSFFIALCIPFGYALLGATRLLYKTRDELQNFFFKKAKWLLFIAAIAMLCISLWTPFVDTYAKQRWFASPWSNYITIIPILCVILFIGCWRALAKKKENQPFFFTIGIFLCGYLGLGYSVWPYIIPYQITIDKAASPDNALLFILVGAIIMLPVLIAYTAYSYYIFRGKVDEVIEY